MRLKTRADERDVSGGGVKARGEGFGFVEKRFDLLATIGCGIREGLADAKVLVAKAFFAHKLLSLEIKEDERLIVFATVALGDGLGIVVNDVSTHDVVIAGEIGEGVERGGGFAHKHLTLNAVVGCHVDIGTQHTHTTTLWRGEEISQQCKVLGQRLHTLDICSLSILRADNHRFLPHRFLHHLPQTHTAVCVSTR
jgi:hypothetical protein